MKHKKLRFKDFNVESYFNKIYVFKSNENWRLPSEAFTTEKWQINSLLDKKHKLNTVKEQLSKFNLEEWSLHTKMRDPSTTIVKTIRSKYQPELLTQAWCKFYECLSKNDLLPCEALRIGVLRTFHLCEAPGGFVTSLNHFLRLFHPDVELQWLGTTLNPEYEGNPLNNMIPDDRLIYYTKDNWIFGEDWTGDITKFYNYQYILQKCLNSGKMSMVTADGSVNCMDDPGDQERNVSLLHYCEVITALSILETGGTFVLKIFTTFEESTISTLYLLNCAFVNVSIFKPITSKSGNSECYVLCKLYKGISVLTDIWEQLLKKYESPENTSMFKLNDLDENFLKQIHECSDFFMEKQIKTINDNIKHFLNTSSNEITRLKAFHGAITQHFINMYHINTISKIFFIVPNHNVSASNRTYKFSTNDSSFAYYYNKLDRNLNIKCIYGKTVEKILFSQYCNTENLDKINLFSVNTSNSPSLFTLVKSNLLDKCCIYDLLDFKRISNHSEFQKMFIFKIIDNFDSTKNIVLINIPFISNVMVQFLYILSKFYNLTNFFQNGIIYLDHFRGSYSKLCVLFESIRSGYDVSSSEPCKFKNDVLSIINDEIDMHFLRCIWFYNNNK